ncbi:WD repeat-containing protein 76-like isoform X2 [Palaemon carinicauda]|uniref:WD repeat-containing protein 76-like isoform X2 n=1 Tax=Palaemon carinicauda TaxID=392227 RepID=UPI0035B6A8EB
MKTLSVVSSSSERRPLNEKRSRKNAMLSSDSESEGEHMPPIKKIRREVGEQQEPETPKRNVRRGRRSRQTKKESPIVEKISTVKSEIEVKHEIIDDTYNENEDIASPYVGLSDYEIQIQKNLEARAKFMNSLDIFAAKENLLELSPKPVKRESRGIARERKTPPEPQEIRRSLRQRNMTPDGSDLPLPSDKEVAQSENRYVEDKPRPPPGPAPLMDYYEKSHKEECEETLSGISNISKSSGENSVWSGSMTSVLKTLKEMKIKDDLVAKVTPQRTFSIQLHPSEDKTLLLIGAKWGELGVWDVERKDSTDGAYYFNIHSRPINCLTIQNSRPELIYTTSYDGSVRRTNLSSGIVEEVYSLCKPEETGRRWISWHAHRDENSFLVGGSDGYVVHCDLRDLPGTSKSYDVHDKSVKVVTVHPTQNHYFATASQGSVRLWDLRKHKKNHPISEVVHAKVVSGLEFSPVTGTRLVSTSKDDSLRIISCDLTTLSVAKKISHDNQTGRWLTTFRARFFPNREDLIIVGSMKQPRRIEVFDIEGRLHHNLMGESFGSVSSITAVHPTLPIIAGANSSGKAFVFKTGV